MRTKKEEGGAVTTGYLILSALTVVFLCLAFADPLYLVFAIPLVMIFTLGASADKKNGSVDEDLEAVGWSDKGMALAIPLGIIGGMLTLFLGSIITRYTPETAAIFVPDYSGIAKLASASVIPTGLALTFNIFAQWAVVSPAEEALARVLAPFAFMKVFKNMIVAFILAALFWMAMHIPTYLAQNANQGMYVVLALLATVTTVLYVFTKNLMSAIVCHSVFNTGVLLSSNNFDSGTMYIVLIISAILIYAWFSGVLATGKGKVNS